MTKAERKLIEVLLLAVDKLGDAASSKIGTSIISCELERLLRNDAERKKRERAHATPH